MQQATVDWRTGAGYVDVSLGERAVGAGGWSFFSGDEHYPRSGFNERCGDVWGSGLSQRGENVSYGTFGQGFGRSGHQGFDDFRRYHTYRESFISQPVSEGSGLLSFSNLASGGYGTFVEQKPLKKKPVTPEERLARVREAGNGYCYLALFDVAEHDEVSELGKFPPLSYLEMYRGQADVENFPDNVRFVLDDDVYHLCEFRVGSVYRGVTLRGLLDLARISSGKLAEHGNDDGISVGGIWSFFGSGSSDFKQDTVVLPVPAEFPAGAGDYSGECALQEFTYDVDGNAVCEVVGADMSIVTIPPAHAVEIVGQSVSLLSSYQASRDIIVFGDAVLKLPFVEAYPGVGLSVRKFSGFSALRIYHEQILGDVPWLDKYLRSGDVGGIVIGPDRSRSAVRGRIKPIDDATLIASKDRKTWPVELQIMGANLLKSYPDAGKSRSFQCSGCHVDGSVSVLFIGSVQSVSVYSGSLLVIPVEISGKGCKFKGVSDSGQICSLSHGTAEYLLGPQFQIPGWSFDDTTVPHEQVSNSVARLLSYAVPSVAGDFRFGGGNT